MRPVPIRPQRTDEEVIRDAEKLRAAVPDLDVGDIARQLHVPVDRIQTLIQRRATA